MNFNKYFWLIIEYLFPGAVFIYSVIRFNPLLIMISLIWILASLAVTVLNADIKLVN